MPMNRVLLSFLFLLTLTGAIHADDVCKRTAVFFDTDKSILTPVAKHKLDSLIALIGNGEFLIELYGHTDTVGNTRHNEKLAADRILAVHEYLTSGSKGKLQFHETNLTA